MIDFSSRERNAWQKIFLPLGLIIALNLFLLWGMNQEYFFRQLVFWLLGLVVFFLIIKTSFPLERLFQSSWLAYIGTVFLLLLPLFFGRVVRGSSRWVFISDQSFQPSEFAKIFFVSFLAGLLAKVDRGRWKDFLKAVSLSFFPILLLLFQPDLGTAMVFIFAAGVLFLVSSLDKRVVFISLLFLLPVLGLGGKYLLADYQKERVETFFDPMADPLGKGYNLLQAQVAFGSGGFFGRGLGLGGQTRLFFLPERHTDFIFASLGESFGLFGVTLLLFAYGYLFLLAWRKITDEEDDQIFFLKTGLLSFLWFQTFINMAMNLGIVPVTGLPLPLFSVGGSSLLTSFIALGLIFKD